MAVSLTPALSQRERETKERTARDFHGKRLLGLRLGRNTPFAVPPPQAALAAEPQQPAADAGALSRFGGPVRGRLRGYTAGLLQTHLSRACLLPCSMTPSALWLSLPRMSATPMRRAARRRRLTMGCCCR
jgi:hypothetical protein